MPQQILNFGNITYVGIGNGTDGKWLRQLEMQAEFYGVDTNYPENWRLAEDDISPYWPGRGTLLGESEPLLVTPPDHSPRDQATGGNSNLGFSGITRDVNNSPLAGVTVRLFRAIDSTLVQMVTSAADGFYAVSTPYQGEDHFLVCHKSGSPEVAGASIATLEPS